MSLTAPHAGQLALILIRDRFGEPCKVALRIVTDAAAGSTALSKQTVQVVAQVLLDYGRLTLGDIIRLSGACTGQSQLVQCLWSCLD